ncbi:MAG: regulatory protein RecX [Thermoflexales bacterium]
MSHVITALKAQRAARGRVSVYLDGAFAFSLSAIYAVALKVGQEINDAQVRALLQADRQERAQERVLRLLAYRPRSVQEVRSRLQRLGVTEDVIQQTVERLQQCGLLDDRAFSQAWVQSRQERSPRSRRAIAWELQRKGVSNEHIAEALKDVDDYVAALSAARRYSKRLAVVEPSQRRRRLSAYLARRGFDFAVIEEVIAAFSADLSSDGT